MRRVLLVLLPLLLASGCDDVGPPVGAPGAKLRASFPPGGIIDTIRVDAVDPKAVRTAELVAPDGRTTPASYVNAAAAPRVQTGQWSSNEPLRNAPGTITMPGSPLVHAQGGAAFRAEEQLLATISTADIALPDPVVYRRDWRRYRIRVTFGTASNTETREIPAPEPPPK